MPIAFSQVNNQYSFSHERLGGCSPVERVSPDIDDGTRFSTRRADFVDITSMLAQIMRVDSNSRYVTRRAARELAELRAVTSEVQELVSAHFNELREHQAAMESYRNERGNLIYALMQQVEEAQDKLDDTLDFASEAIANMNNEYSRACQLELELKGRLRHEADLRARLALRRSRSFDFDAELDCYRTICAEHYPDIVRTVEARLHQSYLASVTDLVEMGNTFVAECRQSMQAAPCVDDGLADHRSSIDRWVTCSSHVYDDSANCDLETARRLLNAARALLSNAAGAGISVKAATPFKAAVTAAEFGWNREGRLRTETFEALCRVGAEACSVAAISYAEDVVLCEARSNFLHAVATLQKVDNDVRVMPDNVLFENSNRQAISAAELVSATEALSHAFGAREPELMGLLNDAVISATAALSRTSPFVFSATESGEEDDINAFFGNTMSQGRTARHY